MSGSGFNGLPLPLRHAPQGGLYAVRDPWRQSVGPLGNGLQADTYGRSSGCGCSTQKADSFGLVHASIKACLRIERKHALFLARDTTKMSFQDRLSEAMADCTATPKALADAIGVTVQAISQTLSGSTKAFSAENCVRAARYLGVDCFWLATGEGEKRPASQPDDTMALSQEEKDVIVALRVLPPDERQQIISSLLDKARHQVERLEALLTRNQVSTKPTLVPLPKR